MVPSLLIAVVTALPMPTVPFTVRVPVFMIGPSRVSAGSPGVSEGSTVSDPSFCSPDDTVKPVVVPAVVVPAVVVPVVAVVAVEAVAAPVVPVVLGEPMVRLLPADTVSSPMANDELERRTFALPGMQTSAPVPFGTPVVQLAAELHSAEGPPPVQVSLQLNVSVGGALPDTKDEASKRVVVPAMITKPAATTPNRRAERRSGRRSWPRRPTLRSPTLHSPRPCYGERPFVRASRAPSVILSAAPAWR